MGSGCGSVGRAVTFNTRGPKVDSNHRQNFTEHLFNNLFIINCIEKKKINNRGREWPTFLKKTLNLGVNLDYLQKKFITLATGLVSHM